MSQTINNRRRPIITEINPKSNVSEAYRTLRTNIQFSVVDEAMSVLMITSAGPQEGKSTTVANLAVTYAQAEHKVLIIDCDLRLPSMHYTFRRSNIHGLSNLLSNQIELQDIIQQTHIPNLHLITSGPIPPNPSEMLGSKRMTEILEQLKQQYDIILIDTPPALAVTDAQILATKSDGVIIVIDAGKVKRDIALKVKNNLERVQARIIGTVLNNAKIDQESSYYYYYGSDELGK